MKRKTAEWFKRLPIWLKIAIPAGLLVAVGVLLWVVLFSKPNSLSEKDLEDIDTVCLRMEELRDSEEYINSDEDEQVEMLLAAINALAQEGLVDGESVFYEEESGVISYLLSSGVLACEKVGKFEEEVDEKETGTEGTENSSSAEDAAPDETDGLYFAEGLILNAMTDRNKVMARCDELAKKWTEQGIKTVQDTEVTLDDMANLGSMEFVYVKMHGLYAEYKQEIHNSSYELMATSYVFLEQRHNQETDKKFEGDLLNKRIGISASGYFITPAFVDAHYGENDLSGNIIFFGCCELMGKGDKNLEVWTEVLQKKSIGAFVGFHNENYTWYNLSLVDTLMEELLAGEDIQTALNSATARHGKNDNEWNRATGGSVNERHIAAYPVLRGNAQAKLKGIENKPETPDPAETIDLSQSEIVEKTEYATVYRFTHNDYNGNQPLEMYYDLAVLNGSDPVTKKINQQLYAGYKDWENCIPEYESFLEGAANMVYLKVKTNFQYADGKIISFSQHSVSGIGGNSILQATDGYTFSLQTGDSLQLKDLFTGDEATLSKVVLQRWKKAVEQGDLDVSLDEWTFYVTKGGELVVWRILSNFGTPDVPLGIYVGQPLPTPESEPEKVVLSEKDKDQIWKALCFWEYDMDGGTTIYNIFGWDYENGISVETGTLYPIKGNPSTEQIYAEVKKDARQYLIESKVEEAVRLTEQYVRTVNGIVYYQGQNNRGDAEISKDSLQYSYGDGNYYVSYNYWSKKDTPDETAIFVRENGVLHFAGRK